MDSIVSQHKRNDEAAAVWRPFTKHGNKRSWTHKKSWSKGKHVVLTAILEELQEAQALIVLINDQGLICKCRPTLG